MKNSNKQGVVFTVITVCLMFISSLCHADEITLKTIMPNMSTTTKWTSITPVRICYYYYAPPNPPNGNFPVAPGGTAALDMPAEVPMSAKEVLVYIETGQSNSPAPYTHAVHYYLYTMENDGTKYQHMFLFYDYPTGTNMWVTNSNDFWLPVTPNRKIYVLCDIGVCPQTIFWANVFVIGYR